MLVIAGFVIVFSNFLFLIYRYIIAMLKVQEYIFSFNPVYMIGGVIFPVVWWLYSTKEDDWNYWNRKNLTLRMVIINGIMVLVQYVWTGMFDIFVFRICQMKIGRNMSETMILNLCRIVLGVTTGGAGYGLYKAVLTGIETDDMKIKINNFRWQYVVDTRTNIEAKYDLGILRDMKTGKKILIKEVDRKTHMVMVGQSGTGKTSSGIIPMIIEDLNKKMDNMVRRQAALQKLIEKKLAYVESKEGKTDYTEYDIRPVEKHEAEYEAVKKENPDCGITMMAPNASVIKDAIKLCKARGLKINIIDPMTNYKGDNVCMKGLNPFYIPYGMEPEEANILIVHKAETFSETLLAVNEIQKAAETYFRDLNTSVTTNTAITCMLRAYLKKTQTSMEEVHACIGAFEKLRPMVDEIQHLLHIKIHVHEMPKKDNARVDKAEMTAPDPSMMDDITYYDIPDSEVPDEYKAKGMTNIEYADMLKREAQSYYRALYFVLTELLGYGEEKMIDQSRGLRVIMDKLLMDPRMRRVFSAKEENFIDWEKALAENEVTLINTALEIGAPASTGLGLFLMLDLKVAIESRPENTRTPHFITIDEASQYMHPMIEDMFALYRQYGGACTFAFQSFSQLEKSPMTKFLGGVIKGAGTHIAFGRLTPEEMKIYEAMAGIENAEVIQKTISRSSELDPNFSMSQSQRAIKEEKPAISGTDMRQRNFQEVTVFTTNEGKVLGGITAKVSFPDKKEYKDRKIKYVDFSRYAEKDRTAMEAQAVREAKENREKESEKIVGFKTGIKHTLDTEDREFTNDRKFKPLDDEAKKRLGRTDIYLNGLDGNDSAWELLKGSALNGTKTAGSATAGQKAVDGNAPADKPAAARKPGDPLPEGSPGMVVLPEEEPENAQGQAVPAGQEEAAQDSSAQAAGADGTEGKSTRGEEAFSDTSDNPQEMTEGKEGEENVQAEASDTADADAGQADGSGDANDEPEHNTDYIPDYTEEFEVDDLESALEELNNPPSRVQVG